MTGYIAIGDKRGDWSQTGRNCQHTRQSPLRGPKTASLRGSYDAGSTVLSPAIGADGKVYVTEATGKLLVLNADCTLDREVDLGGGIGSSAPALDRAGNIWLNVNNGGDSLLKCVFADYDVHTYAPTRLSGKPVVTDDGQYVLAAEFNNVYLAAPLTIPGDSAWWHKRYIFDSDTATVTYTPVISRDGFIFIIGSNSAAKLAPDMGLLKKVDGSPFGCAEPVAANSGYLYAPSTLAIVGYNSIRRGGADGYWGAFCSLPGTSIPVGSLAATNTGYVYTATNAGR